ncbi:MAG: 16S rRNA (uracil(1498)-N(3))-methyltransferase [Deltaproteobacteria bacterium HGW-Deltaproteobacteria-11]|nr:MAG: 16S rRNA (uracil(1498)-N(3))-methyltransferase [Deltaproteobacteria bacterium HGW-Deltaproteobacteria-11]
MTIPRIFLPCPMNVGDFCALREEDQTYIKSVLRLKKNDHLVVFDGQGHEYQAMISRMQGSRTVVEILKKHPLQDKPVRITLSQALPKAGKMDFIIQKATELGVDRVIPFQSARCVSRLTDDKKGQKVSRWQKIAVEASRQCGRADVPVISPCVDFQEMIGDGERKGVKIIFWEEETQTGLSDVLRHQHSELAEEFFIVVGPEGGFLKEEVDRAREAGFQSVSIGRQILRVETAVLAILSIIQYEKGILGGSLCSGSER